jgi:hypothetical protein
MIIVPMGFGWIRYESDAPYPEKVKKIPHVAFEVENLDEAIKGKKVLFRPTVQIKVSKYLLLRNVALR